VTAEFRDNHATCLLVLFTDEDVCIPNFQEADAKEASAKNADSYIIMSTSHCTTQLSTCNDQVPVDIQSETTCSVDSNSSQLDNTKQDIQNVQEVYVKEKATATSTDSYINMCTSASTSQLSTCSDHVPVDSNQSDIHCIASVN